MFDAQQLNAQIYLDHHDKVAAYVAARLHDPTAVEDLVATIFLKVYDNIGRYDPARASLSTWIYSITRNTLITYFRQLRPVYPLDESAAEPVADIDERIVNDEMLELLARALDSLEPRERDMLVLHYYQDMTLRQSAALMGLSYAGAKLVHKRALDKLKVMLDT